MKGSGLMEVVLPLSRLGEMTAYMDERVSRHLHEGQSEAFEGFEEFDLIAFDWYDVHSDWTEDSRFLLYLDREHLLCFCEEERDSGGPGRSFPAWRRSRIFPTPSGSTASLPGC